MGLGREGDVVRLHVRPTLADFSMPEGEVPQFEDLPNSVLFDVFVLVDSAFPPLHQSPWVFVRYAVVRTGGHDSTESHPGMSPVVVDITDILHHGVVKQEPMNWAIAAFDKELGEAVEIETLYALLATISPTKEFNEGVRIVGKKLGDLLIEALVKVVAVLVVKFSNVLLGCGEEVNEVNKEIIVVGQPRSFVTSVLSVATASLSSCSSEPMSLAMIRREKSNDAIRHSWGEGSRNRHESRSKLRPSEPSTSLIQRFLYPRHHVNPCLGLRRKLGKWILQGAPSATSSRV